MLTVKQPHEYIEQWKRTGVSSPLQLRRKTNRHTQTGGGSWGWYEVFPLDITVGHWGDYCKDDGKGFDIEAWNADAARLCSTPNTPPRAGEKG